MQVLGAVANPALLSSPDLPSDVKNRVETILGGCGGKSAGAYSQSTGVDVIRKHVAEFIQVCSLYIYCSVYIFIMSVS